MRNHFVGVAIATAFALPAGVFAQEAGSLETRAVAWLDLLRSEKFDSAVSVMAPVARERMNAEQLKAFWPQILERYGKLEKLTPSNRLQQNGLEVVQLLGYFEKGTQNVRVSFDSEGRVAGFFIVGPGGQPPASAQADARQPPDVAER